MTDIEMIVEFALRLIHAKTGSSLSYIQKVILQESLSETKKTYAQIAQENSYSESYLKHWIAPKLWQVLSEVLSEKVNKTNCRTLLEHALSQHSAAEPSLPPASSIQPFGKAVAVDCGKPSCSAVSPPKLIALDPPQGQIPLASTLYIDRPPIEINAYQAILQPRAFIRIKAPEKMGKTSLMVRILANAADQNYHTVRLSLNRAGTQVYASTDRFL